ncbi:MAG: HAMP domain-containing histidine kinase [Chitinophagaceae bacterium]|nr:HAMP domain-containing histidine kinase [Anaerolineae bacterium]
MLNGNSKTAITLLTIEPPSWTDELLNYLKDHGYLVTMMTAMDDELKFLKEQSPDAIIIVNPAGSQHFFQRIRAQTSHPLLVLITDNFTGDLPYETADAVLPPRPHYVDCQLQMLLHLRAANEDLQKQNLTLNDEVKKLKEELIQRKRTNNEVELLKNAIVHNISHELKTPLLQVKAAVSLIAEDLKDNQLSQLAVNATARLEILVKNVTLLGSSLDINLGPVITRDAIEYARRNLGRVWEHREDGTRIKVHLEDHLPPVLADKQAISTALQLLMDNALKFSKKDIEVRAVVNGDHVKISVRDFGIGIAKDQLDAIFEMFYQVDSSSTRRYGGMGVGLAIVRIILERHNTEINVESRVDEGSTFSFMLKRIDI